MENEVPPLGESQTLQQCVSRFGRSIRIRGSDLPGWSRDLLINGPGVPVELPRVFTRLTRSIDVDSVQAMYSPMQFASARLEDVTVFGHRTIQQAHLNERCHLYHGRQKIGSFQNILLMRSHLPLMPDGEVYLVELAKVGEYCLGSVRRKFHEALIQCSSSASPFPSTWERWVGSEEKELIRVLGSDVTEAWGRMLAEMTPQDRAIVDANFRVVLSIVDIKRSIHGFGLLPDKLANIRRSLGTFITAIVDVGAMIVPDEAASAVYPGRNYIARVRERCRRVDMYPLFCSNVCMGYVGVDGRLCIREKCYDVKTELAMKAGGAGILDDALIQPAESEGGPLGAVEQYLSYRSPVQRRKVEKAKGRCIRGVETVLKCLKEYQGQAGERVAARFEWTFALERTTDASILSFVQGEVATILTSCEIVSAQVRSELAVRAGSTLLAEVLGRGQDGNQALRVDRGSLAYRALMESMLKSVVLTPNYRIRHFRALIKSSGMELAAMRYGVPSFACMEEAGLIDPIGMQVLTVAPEHLDGDKDLRQLVRMMRCVDEVPGTCLLWGLYTIKARPDDFTACSNAIKVVDLACNYAFYKARGVLLEGAGTFQDGPMECYRRLQTVRYTPTVTGSHSSANAKVSAVPVAGRTISLGEYLGHRFGKYWCKAQGTASYLAFNFWLSFIGQERKEEALVALRSAFQRGEPIQVVPPAIESSPMAKIGVHNGSSAYILVDEGPIRSLGSQGVDVVLNPQDIGYRLGQVCPAYPPNGYDADQAWENSNARTQDNGRWKRYEMAAVMEAIIYYGGVVRVQEFLRDPNNGLIRQERRDGGLVQLVRRSESSIQTKLAELRRDQGGQDRNERQNRRQRAERDSNSLAFLAAKRLFILTGETRHIDNDNWTEWPLTEEQIQADARANNVQVGPVESRFTSSGVERTLVIPQPVTQGHQQAQQLFEGWRRYPLVSERCVGFAGLMPEPGLPWSTELFEALLLFIDEACPVDSAQYAIFSPSTWNAWAEQATPGFNHGLVTVFNERVVSSSWGSVESLILTGVPIFIIFEVGGRIGLALVWDLLVSTQLTTTEPCHVIVFASEMDGQLHEDVEWMIKRFLLHLASAAVMELDEHRVQAHFPVCAGQVRSELDFYLVADWFNQCITCMDDIPDLIIELSLDPNFDVQANSQPEQVMNWFNSIV